jgi:CelD/BcsL family acetyltransferase involved in cellulose biosynthesis
MNSLTKPMPIEDLTVPEATIPTASIGPKLSAAAIRNDAELTALSEEWEQLFQRSGCANVFLSFQWILQWWTCMGHGHSLFVVTVRDDERRLVALAPLYISQQAGPLRIRRLGFLGDSLVGSDYLDVLVDGTKGPAALQCLSIFILSQKKEWDYIDLSDTLPDSNATCLCENLVANQMKVEVVPSSICPYVILPGSAEGYLSSLGPKVRKRLRYNLRALQREGAVEFATARSGPDLEKAFDELLQLHRARLGTRGGTSAFLDPRIAPFHRAVLGPLSAAGRVRIHLLKLRGVSIAALYALSAGPRMFYYQSGMHPEYGRFSVGSVLIRYAIEDAILSHCHEFDFLRGDEPYKFLWTNGRHQMRCMRVFDDRAKSRIAHASQMVRTSLQNCKALVSTAIRVKTACHETVPICNVPRRSTPRENEPLV